jgi:RNA polymerase sigma-70 factor (ECF subfamily)
LVERRSALTPPDDDLGVGVEHEGTGGETPLASLYDRALPQVYGYLLPRCGSAVLAEDLTAATFMAAVAGAKQDRLPELTVAWLVGVARHKLVDHWRRADLERRRLGAIVTGAAAVDDPWEAQLDVAAAHAALPRLPAHQRTALTLRYLDGLPVAEVAQELGRSLHGTGTLLVRAPAALRRVYEEGEGHDA